MKNFERKDKNERRRVLLSKNHELSYSYRNEKLPKGKEAVPPNGLGAMAKLGILTRKQLRVIIAVFVAVCVIVPSMVFVGLQGKAEHEQISRVTVDGLETVKTVSPVEGEDGKYHVKLEAYNTSEFLNQPANDIILVLDNSSRMDEVLYHREYINLVTHTMFDRVPDSNATYNHLHDGDNPHNDGSVDVFNTYKYNKYVMDPNTPGAYVYLSSTYYADSLIGLTAHHYVYSFTDSNGNVYEYTSPRIGSISSITNPVGTMHFELVSENPVGNPAQSVDISDFYYRHDTETNAINSTIESYAGTGSVSATQTSREDNRVLGAGTIVTTYDDTVTYNEGKLFILSDSGEKLPVTIVANRTRTVTETYVAGVRVNTNTDTYYSKYTYSCTDPTNGKTYIAVQGNEVFGAEYGVFQGFKTYQWKVDSDGNYVYKLDGNGIPTSEHELEVVHSESIESKSLYAYTSDGQDVTRLDAMKEAIENFAIKVHQDSYYKGTDVRLGIVTYGKDGEVYYPLTSVYDEIGVNKLIDNMYHMETESTVIGLVDSNAAQIDEGMETAYNHFAEKSPPENKRFLVAFTAGMPTKNYWGYNTNENTYSTDVATGAIQYAYKMKNEQAVNIYSLGMYENAKASETHGDWFYYTIWPKYKCSGNVGSIWGATTGATINPFREVDVTDAAAINRMMNYISSDYADATNIGLYRRTLGLNPAGYALTTAVLSGKGYQITKNFDQTDKGHYYAVSTRNDNGEEISGDQINADLQAVFDQLAHNMEVAQGYLTGSAQLRDTITDYFDLVPESVTYKTMNYQGPTLDSENCWTDDDVSVTPGTEYPNDPDFEAEAISLTVDPANLTADTKELTLTGFPYSENYVVEDKHVTNKAGNYGKKVVLEFDIVRTDGLIGGNYVPTNATSSGVFDEDTHLEENFEVPHVDLSIIAENIHTEDQSIYYSYEADLAELLDSETTLNGFNNQFVDITYTITDPDDPTNTVTFTVPAGETAPSEQATLDRYPQLTESKTYSVTVTIDPEIREPASAQTAVTRTTLDPMDANVYVFIPALDVLDETVDVGDEVDLTPTEHDPAWVCDLNVDNDEENDVTAPRPSEEAPEITYQIINKTDNNSVVPEADWDNYQINETQDFQVVNVTIPARTFTYYYPEEVQATDGDGNLLTDDDGNPVMVTEIRTVEVNRTAVVMPQADVSFTNTTAPSKTDGSYTKFTGKLFDFYLSKQFVGDYVNPEGVTFTISGSDGSSQTLTINANEFTRLQSGNKQTTDQLRTGITYTVTEAFVDAETDESKYDTTFSGKWVDAQDTETAVADADNDETNEVFVFTIPNANEPTAVYLAVTNTDTSEPPVVTGRSASDSKLNPYYIAATVVALMGGGGTVYFVKRKQDAEA